MAMLPLAVMDAMSRVWKSMFVRSSEARVVHLHHHGPAWDGPGEELLLEWA